MRILDDILDRVIGYEQIAFSEVKGERARQDVKWGLLRFVTEDPEHWFTILGEEVGEVAHAILEHDEENYHDELVQVAAVAIAAIIAYDMQHRFEGEVSEAADVPLSAA